MRPLSSASAANLATATNATPLRQRTGTSNSSDGIFGIPRISSTDKNATAKAAQALEQTFVKTLLQSSGAFDLGEGAGASFTEDAFVSAIADAVASGTGLGISSMMQRSLPSTQTHKPTTAPTDLVSLLVDGAGRKTSAFGLRRDPFTGAMRNHSGVDIGAKAGTPVSAAQDGRVVFAGERGGYGNTIEIQAQDGTRTLYAHLSAIDVQKGDAIAAGAQIGAVGSSGRSTGAHLHVEVRRNGARLDPEQVLKTSPSRVETHDEHHRSSQVPSLQGGTK